MLITIACRLNMDKYLFNPLKYNNLVQYSVSLLYKKYWLYPNTNDFALFKDMCIKKRKQLINDINLS